MSSQLSLRSSLVSVLAVLVAPLVACGGSSAKTPDASVSVIDAAPLVDAAPPLQDAAVIPGCDFVESADLTNDQTSEATGLTVTTGTKVICGSVTSTHFDATNQVADADLFDFNVGAGGADLLIQVTGSGLDAAGSIFLDLADQAGQTGYGSAVVVGAYGLFNSRIHVPEGAYTLLVESDSPTALAASHDYKVKLLIDTPATRCAKIAAAAAYTESHDGASNNGNDVISDDANGTVTLTANAADAPEPTGLTLAAGDSKRISGSSAMVALTAAYSDPDTYEITTGPTTTELTYRLNWASITADLDVVIYPADSLSSLSGSFKSSPKEDEFQTTAVLPNTKYRVWVGAYMTPASTAAVPYDLSLCANAYVPQ
jgi:hypothetical protein